MILIQRSTAIALLSIQINFTAATMSIVVKHTVFVVLVVHVMPIQFNTSFELHKPTVTIGIIVLEARLAHIVFASINI